MKQTRLRVRHRAALLARRIGRRGASLIFVGALSAVLAANLWFLPPTQSISPSYTSLTLFAPLWAWAAAWATSALVCWWQAFIRQDRIAFALASAMWWLYGIAFVSGLFTGINPRGWVGGLIWIAFGAWLTVIATWPEAINLRQLPGGRVLSGAVIVADTGGAISSWSPDAEALFGWTATQALGKPLTMLMPERFRADHDAGLARVRQTGISPLAGQVIALTALHRDGHEFPIELTINVWEAPDGFTYAGVARLSAGGP